MSSEKKCQRPERLKGKPGECSAEQIEKCHGAAADHPCTPAGECEQPDRLKDTPERCSPEQVKECHGDAKTHPCARED